MSLSRLRLQKHPLQNQPLSSSLDSGFVSPSSPVLSTSAERKEAWRLSDPWQGVLWKILSCGCFAFLNVIVRYLTGGAGHSSQPLSPYEIAFIQDFLGCVLIVPWLVRRSGWDFRLHWPLLHVLRSLAAVSGVIALYFAFAHMEITKAVALGMTGPVFTVIGAWLFLKEKIHFWRGMGIILGFAGIWFVARPDVAFTGTKLDDLDWTLALPLLSAALFAVSKICGRALAQRGEKPAVLAVVLMVFMAPGVLVTYGFFYCLSWTWLPPVTPWVVPTLDQWYLLALLGGLSFISYYSLGKSYALAEVSFVTPFGITRLLFSALLGFILFSEMPTALTLWVGVGVILLSTICLSLDRSS